MPRYKINQHNLLLSFQSQGPRIARMERQLLGVDNLPGKLMAVDEMADELGIEIPNMEVGCSLVIELLQKARRLD